MQWQHRQCCWYHVCQCQWCLYDPKNFCIPFQLSWPQECSNAIGIMWCWYQWHHVTLKLMAMESQKSHVASHLNHLDLRTSWVSLMTEASCDPDADNNGITWPKSHTSTHFDCLDLQNIYNTGRKIHCSGLLGDRDDKVFMIVSSGRWSWKGKAIPQW